MCTLIAVEFCPYATNYTKTWAEQASSLPAGLWNRCSSTCGAFSCFNFSPRISGSAVGWEDFCHPQLFETHVGTGSRMQSGQTQNEADFFPLSSWKAGVLFQEWWMRLNARICMSVFCIFNNTVPHCLLVLRETEAVFTRMGVYHFRFWVGFLLWAFLGLGSKGSYSCSGIFTTAFFGFSSLAPSSVEPFPPQRTYRQQATHEYTTQYK